MPRPKGSKNRTPTQLRADADCLKEEADIKEELAKLRSFRRKLA